MDHRQPLHIQTATGEIYCAEGLIAQEAVESARLLQGESYGPGRVCAHTHLYSGLAPLGMPGPEPPPENFLQILERVWWRLDRALDADSLGAAAQLYVAESLLMGTTTLVDHHESPNFIEGSLDVLAYACDHLGMRALLCFGATERNGGRREGDLGLDECVRFIEERQTPTIQGMMGLHASFTVSDDTIRRAGDLAREHGTILHVHVAEDAADVSDAMDRGFAGPLERLVALDALTPGSILAHGVHLSPEQVAQVGRLGCWLVHNPRSNTGNGVGYAQNLSASHRIALGTDGYPADMQQEMQHVAEGIAVAEERLDNGRQLVGERFGIPFELEAGGSADLVVYNQEGNVTHVVVDGRVVVENGCLTYGDIDVIRAEAADAAARLWKRMGEV